MLLRPHLALLEQVHVACTGRLQIVLHVLANTEQKVNTKTFFCSKEMRVMFAE
jgi:hypothetical protein